MSDIIDEEPVKIEGPRKSPDEWAQSKGHVFKEGHKVAPKCAILEGAKHHHGWVRGTELTEAEFDAGMTSFLEEPIR